jgi:hypothetical protein
VHRRLERERPDLLRVLYDGFTFRRREVDAEYGNGALVRHIAVFARGGDEISVFLSGDYPNRAVAAGDAVMTAQQREALDEMQRMAATPDTYLDMDIGEGDIQFLNNRLLLHGRTGYEDHRAMARRRHLLRLWLKVPGWPPQPADQAMHTAEDHPLWLRQRTPFMEVPSRYLSEITARQAELAQ